jgi:RNA polymerase sigma-70 factor (ECF subfamily)
MLDEHYSTHTLLTKLDKLGGTWPVESPLPNEWQEQDDGQLIALFQHGNRLQKDLALTGLFNRYCKRVAEYLERKVDQQTARDIFSEVWYIAFKKLERFEWRGITFDHWLLSTAHNLAEEHFRKQQAAPFEIVDIESLIDYIDQALESEQDSLLPPAPADRELIDHVVEKLLSEISVRDRRIIELRYFGEKNIAEISVITGESQNNIRVILHRVIKKLKKRQ